MTDPDLLDFIRNSIRSVWALELLLLLKARPDRASTAPELVQALRASTTVVHEALSGLELVGLVQGADEGFRYAPASPALAQLCDQIEQAYRERPVRVINAIVSAKAKMQTFADAFRLKDDPE